MTRTTLVRPPTELITSSNGQLTEEWSRKFDELFLWAGEQQNAIEDPDDGSQALTEEQIQELIDTSITAALATRPTITTYSEDFVLSPSTILTINHDLDVADPLWSVRMDTYADRRFVLYGTGTNTHDLRWNSTINRDATVTLYKIEIP